MFNKSSLVFEISSTSLKMIEAEYSKEKSKINIINHSIIPISRGKSDSEESFNEIDVANKLKKEIKNKKIKAEKFLAVVSGEGIITRDILLEKLPEKEINNIFRHEATQYFPVDLSKYVLDYKILADVMVGEEEKYKILLVAVPDKIIDRHVSVGENGGIILDSIDVNSNALAKFINFELRARNQLSDDSVSAILNVDNTGSYVVFTHNGIFDFGREIRFGANDIIKVLSDYLAVEPSKILTDIDQYVNKYVLVDENDLTKETDEEVKLVVKDVSKILKSFSDEVSKVVEFYRSKYYNSSNMRLFVTGGGAKILKVDQILKKSLTIDIEQLSQLKCIDEKSIKGFDQFAMYYANLLGALVR